MLILNLIVTEVGGETLRVTPRTHNTNDYRMELFGYGWDGERIQ